MIRFSSFVVAAIFFVLPLLAQAQEMPKQIEDATLRYLYERQLQFPDDAYLKKRVSDERSKIRLTVEEELTKTIVPTTEEEYLDESALTKAVDRQQNVLSLLRERLRDRRADIDLLSAEEEHYYGEIKRVASGAVADEFRLTKSHPELLAKKAILEERIGVMESVLSLQESRLEKLQRDQNYNQFRLFISIGRYVLIVVIVITLERLMRVLIFGRIRNPKNRYTVTKVSAFIIYAVMALWILGVLFSSQPSILASFAIVAAGLAISLQDLVKDILGWMLIYQNGLFVQGHRISIGPYTGEVLDIGIFRTTLLEVGIPPASVLEHTGKTLTIPNHLILNAPLTNYNSTSDFTKAEMKFTITYESDWQRAEAILREILIEEVSDFAKREKHQHAARTHFLFTPYEPGGPHVYKEIAGSGILFTLRFTVPVGQAREIVSHLTERILKRFATEENVELAYTTSRAIVEEKNPKTGTQFSRSGGVGASGE